VSDYPQYFDFEHHAAAQLPALEGSLQRGVLWQASGSGRTGQFELAVPGVARYWVEGGERILVQPDGGSDAAIQQFLGATPLAALLYQRGLLTLHASAVFLPPAVLAPQGTILLAGVSGAGKSSLLAGLIQRGATALCDDLAPMTLDEHGRVVVLANPGTVRLWPDSRQRLGISAEQTLTIAAPAPGCRDYPVRAIVWLVVSNTAEVALKPVQGLQRFDILGKLSYNSQIADALLERAAFFKLAAAVSAQVPIIRLLRPSAAWDIEALCQAVTTGIFQMEQA